VIVLDLLGTHGVCWTGALCLVVEERKGGLEAVNAVIKYVTNMTGYRAIPIVGLVGCFPTRGANVMNDMMGIAATVRCIMFIIFK